MGVTYGKSIRIFIHDEINLTDVAELNAKFIVVQTYWKAKKTINMSE